jgi:hypothetical protein
MLALGRRLSLFFSDWPMGENLPAVYSVRIGIAKLIWKVYHYSVRHVSTELFQGNILWHIDLLLGNDGETNNEATDVASQRPSRHNGSTVGSNVFYVTRSEPVWLDRPSSVQLVSAVQLSRVEWSLLFGGQSFRRLLQFGRCELLLLGANSWGTGIVREPTVRRTSAVVTRYQVTTAEDTEDWKELVRAVVNCWVCELAIAL